MANIIKRIYELQDIGKGVISSLTEDNLLLLTDSAQGVQGLQDVLSVNSILPITNDITTEQQLYIKAYNEGDGANFTGVSISDDVYASSITPNVSIGKGIGNNFTDISLSFFPTKAIFRDGVNSRGLEYYGDYEANFTDRTLVTKQYVDDEIATIPSPTGAETKVTAGTNITVTGVGTTVSPYIINSTAVGASTIIDAGTNISVTGDGSIGTPFIITNTQVIDGSETKINDSSTITKTGTGTTIDPYILNVVETPSQKMITYPGDFSVDTYTILSSDKDKLIFINNGVNDVNIEVPTGLNDEHSTAFIRQGTGDVTFFSVVGTTIYANVGNRIKNQYDAVCLDKVLNTEVFHLTGNTQV